MTISDIDRPKKASFIKIRFIIVLMTTLCPVVCYMSRQNLSLAIVAMVNETGAIKQSDTTTHNQSDANTTPYKAQPLDVCPEPIGDGDTKVKLESYGPKYEWTAAQRSLLFEAFFFTYVIFQIPSARFAEIVGAKWILTTAATGSAIISFFAPWAASVHPYALAALRALMGVCQTALFPAGYVLYTQWLPPAERSQALPVLGAGAYFGAIIASSATGYFSEQPTMGWPYAFYMPGVACSIWAIIWVFLGTSEPRQHRFISLEEIDYIESRKEIRKSIVLPKKSISWRKILTSRHIIIMAIGFFASNWAFHITLIQIPSYLNSILRVPNLKNGLINSVIYALFIVSCPIVGCVSALMVETRAFGLTRLQIRKLFQGTAVFSQAICFLLLPLIGCNITLVLVVLFTQVVLFSFINGGEVQLPSELSLDFAGTIFAIGNCVGSSTGAIVPRVHSLIVPDVRSRDAWNTYFYLGSLVTSIGGLIFVLFAKNDMQDFSKDDTEDDFFKNKPQDLARIEGSKNDVYVMSIDQTCNLKVAHRNGDNRNKKQIQLTC